MYANKGPLSGQLMQSPPSPPENWTSASAQSPTLHRLARSLTLASDVTIPKDSLIASDTRKVTFLSPPSVESK
ncbi:jg3124 [Pararge aegeria aegeria]|uniref:Jg3124 protein n=1 Tax=Pararge aegeria aegeria TaxID=348720 RepID=A0A8S4RFT0_9NEOP|nr:jg3124 [Pararge aegeria aegeria]